MTKLRYTFKSDILFKLLFVKNPNLLKDLVAAILKTPVKSITELEILNPEMTPALIESKFCRLDINMKVNGQRVDIEIQVTDEGNYLERVLFYWARDYSSALPAGQDYSLLPRTIIVSITDFLLFDCKEYHSFFQPLEVNRYTLLSNKMGFHFFELPKLPTKVSEDNSLLLWLSLFNADTEEDLEKINKMEVSVMSEAISAYRAITASPEYRELERLREKAGHDEAQALLHAKIKGREEGKAEGKAEVIQSFIKMGMPLEQIMRATGMTQKELKTLLDSTLPS